MGRQRESRRTGFTLVELMIAVSLGSIVMIGVLTTFIMIGRSGMRVVNYSLMETQTRRAFEKLAIDARMANGFFAHFTGGVVTAFTLSIPGEDLLGNRSITYGFDTSNSNDKTFFYVEGNSPTATPKHVLISNLKSLTILRYTAAIPPVEITSTTGSTGIKHLQISVSVSRSGSRVMEATQVIRSTAFTMRNM
jgi:prepilin-type N-terminal cleavage/methylation domain-containing protein